MSLKKYLHYRKQIVHFSKSWIKIRWDIREDNIISIKALVVIIVANATVNVDSVIFYGWCWMTLVRAFSVAKSRAPLWRHRRHSTDLKVQSWSKKILDYFCDVFLKMRRGSNFLLSYASTGRTGLFRSLQFSRICHSPSIYWGSNELLIQLLYYDW